MIGALNRGRTRLAASTLVVVGTLVLTPGMSLAEPSHGDAATTTTHGSPTPSAADWEGMASGIIVKNRPGISARSTQLLSATTISRVSGASVTAIDARTLPGTSVYRFAEPVPASTLAGTIAWLRLSGAVAWAEPDLLLRRQAPVIPNDPDFEDQWHLWEGGGSRDRSIEAPLGWQYSSGKSTTVVAVLDTGWTEHPDLDARNINGYDFVSDPANGNDGNGRDADARDPGDWVTASESYGEFSGCDESDSSWHGTHVAGIVAAQRGNGRGVSGVAPEARVLSVRVLGKCGGSISDIAAAIRWASGAPVSGVPDNPNPAQVINMSLGGSGSCGSTFRDAISTARSNGTVVVAAAGNESNPISRSTPANCPGVISVVATNPSGSRTSWSNYGTGNMPAGAAAPGESILSTYNSGRRGPANPTYSRASGTSMAAPVVAGAAALLVSLGVKPADVPAALTRLVKPFPGGNCSTVSCGAGLLDLSRLELFAAPDPDPDPGPEPEPGPTPEPEPGPTPLTVPGIIADVRVRYAIKGERASAQVSWAHTAGAQRSIYYLYRVKRGSDRWQVWTKRVAPSLVIGKLPRSEMSFLEIRGVNEMGQGRIYQLTLYPKR